MPIYLQRRSFAVLSHRWAGGRAAPPGGRVAVLLHGILGSKANWNTPAKRLLEQVGPQGWHVLQLDLRAHGQSPLAQAPHSLEACAADVAETLSSLDIEAGGSNCILCGHSFGGKVALSVLRARLVAALPPPKITWLFDSFPGVLVEQHSAEERRMQQTTRFVLSAIQGAADRGVYPERSVLVDTLETEYGLRRPVAEWVAQSVRREPDGIRLAFDVSVVTALYDSYCATDMWDVLEGGQADIGIVVAGRNAHYWPEEHVRRLLSLGRHVQMVTLDGAGHNVHVDDLPGLLAAIQPSFND